jgi:hypothetical protein
MEQVKYQGYARERGFNPTQMSTASVEAIGQQGSNLLRQMQKNSDIERRNRDAYQSQVERNQGIEEQNRRENRQFERASDRAVFEGRAQNYRISIDNILRQQQDTEKTFVALSSLSGTLAKTVSDWKTQKDEREKLEAYEYEKVYGSSDQQISQVQTQLNAIYKTDELIQNTADGLQASNAAPEVVHSVRKLSSAGKIGQALARFEAAARRYPGWLDQQRLENTSLEIQYVDPATGIPTIITPQSAVGREQTRIVSQELFKQYIKENGFLDYKPGLASPFLKMMREAEQRVLDEAGLSYNIASSEQLLEETKSSVVPELRTNPGSAFNRLTQAYSRSLDERGNPLGYRAARQKAMAFIRQGIDVGQIDRAAIDLIQASPTAHQPNKTWGDLYPYEFAKLSEEIDNNYLEDSRREDSLLQQEGKKWADSVLADMVSNPPSKETIQQIIKHSIDTFGSVDDRLQYYANNFTQEKLDADTLNKEFEALAQSNRLTAEMVTDPRVPWTVRQQWENIARQQSNARSQTGDFKASEEAIESAILAAAKWNSATGDPKHYTISLATAAAKANFNNIVTSLLKGGKSTPEQAAQQALQQVITDIGDGTSGKFSYSQEDQRGFINFGFSGYGTSREATADASKHMEAIKAKLQGGGVASLDRFALIPRPILEQINSVRNSPNVQPPPVAQYISELLGGRVSSWEILNRQLTAQKFEALPVPEPMQQVNQTISPTLRNLLLYKPSPNRSYRAYTSATQFNPSLVPNGYGQLIAEVASANGVDPGLLAGLVRVESGFNANAVSRSGAIGLGQLMPGTAQELGVNPRDPRQNLQGAARYLRKMTDMFAGDQTAALRAYNQGPGNQQRYPNGVSEEARSYPRKVLQAAAAFGYNPNGGSPWRTEATMRPKLVYRIDGIGPTSTGPHLDVKDTGGRNFGRYDLDKYIEVEVKGRRKPLSTVMTDDQAAHRRRGSHGIDFAYPAGTPVFLKNGARVVSNSPTEHGDKLVIQLPNGRTFSFLHGRKA